MEPLAHGTCASLQWTCRPPLRKGGRAENRGRKTKCSIGQIHICTVLADSARNQYVSVATQFMILWITVGRHTKACNFSSIVDGNGVCQIQIRARCDERIQINHGSSL